jgi:enoyl-CoA hydratase
MEKQCLLEIHDKTALITINRPPMNTISRETLYMLGTLLTEIEGNESIGAVILTGAGEKMFSAGADVGEFGDFGDDNAKKTVQGIHEIFVKIESFPKPIIACVNGKALGGGNELQMACHLAIAAETAEFALPEVRLGIIPGYGGTQRLPRLIGKRRALELILSGDRISAGKALEYGLINRVVPQDQLLNEARNWGQQLAEGPPLAVKGILEAVMKGSDSPLEAGLSTELEHMLTVSRSEDAIEGVTAFFSKRKPEFKGR